MEKRLLAPGIFVYSDVIPNHDLLVNDIEESLSGPILSWIESSIKGENGIEVDKKYRDTLTFPVPYRDHILTDFQSVQDAVSGSLSNIFLSNFKPIEEDYKAEHQATTEFHEDYSVLKYSVGQQFVNHIDDHRDFPRKISYVYYFNENYEGGEICFPRFNLMYKPKANEMIFFPSNYVYNHSVSPVTEGTRYAVVSWLT
jgi:Rps23 Pro-64 3,4-dihydroxylase Tpa1-like proline 4-hydroxylase